MLLPSRRHFVAGSAPQPSLRHSPLPHPQRRRRSWSRCFDFLPVCRLTDIRRRVRVRSALLTLSLYRSLLLAALSASLSLSPCLALVRFAIKTGRANSPRQSGSVLSSPHEQQHGAAQKRDSKLWLAQQAAGEHGSKQAGNMLALSPSLARTLTHSLGGQATTTAYDKVAKLLLLLPLLLPLLLRQRRRRRGFCADGELQVRLVSFWQPQRDVVQSAGRRRRNVKVQSSKSKVQNNNKS